MRGDRTAGRAPPWSCHAVDMSKKKRRPAQTVLNAARRGGTLAGELHVVTLMELSPDEYPGEMGTSYG